MVVSLEFLVTIPIVLLIIHNWANIKQTSAKMINRINIFNVGFKKLGIRMWQGVVISYGLWLAINFWDYVIFPNNNESLTPEKLIEIFLKPPYIQLLLIIMFFWLLISLSKLPTFSLKSINTFFFKFEVGKVEELKDLTTQDLEQQRKNEKNRLVSTFLATSPKTLEGLRESLTSSKSRLSLLTEIMGGIVYEQFWNSCEIEYQSGVIAIDSNGSLSSDVEYLWSDLQYVVRTAYRESSECIEGENLAFPILIAEERGIFFLFSRGNQLDEADYLMLLSIWQILLTLVDLSENMER